MEEWFGKNCGEGVKEVGEDECGGSGGRGVVVKSGSEVCKRVFQGTIDVTLYLSCV